MMLRTAGIAGGCLGPWCWVDNVGNIGFTAWAPVYCLALTGNRFSGRITVVFSVVYLLAIELVLGAFGLFGYGHSPEPWDIPAGLAGALG